MLGHLFDSREALQTGVQQVAEGQTGQLQPSIEAATAWTLGPHLAFTLAPCSVFKASPAWRSSSFVIQKPPSVCAIRLGSKSHLATRHRGRALAEGEHYQGHKASAAPSTLPGVHVLLELNVLCPMR